MELTWGDLYKIEKRFPGEYVVTINGLKTSLKEHLEWRNFVINGFNSIIVDHRASKKDKERAQFLIGCIYGFEEYVEENYNPTAVINSQKRRARVRELDHTLTKKEWEETINYFDGKCAYCGEEKGKLAQDHFIPVMNRGSYTKENIVPACKSCNSSKRDKDFFYWFKNRGACTAEKVYNILTFVR